jgi:ankyrin repeat protein
MYAAFSARDCSGRLASRRRLAAALLLACALVANGAARAGRAGNDQATPYPADAPSPSASGLSASADHLRLSREQALWTALAFEDADMLRRLLREGADPNKAEELSMMTPLMAVETAALAEALVESGASVEARDRLGRTPLHYAARMREAAQIIPLLGRRGADPNAHAAGGKGATPLITVVEAFFEDLDKKRCAQLVRLLVQAGARIDEPDDRGDTPLALAAVNNVPELVKLLLELGADPSLRLRSGKTAADYARERGSHDMAALLDRAASTKTRE